VINNRILILGASGFIGNALYKELLSYFDVYGTYCNQDGLYCDNQVFFRFTSETDSITPLLEKIQPRFIISAFSAEGTAMLKTQNELISYCATRPLSNVLYMSDWSVFDARQRFPSYENDKPYSVSVSGKQHIAIEKLLQEQLPFQTTILRLPFVLGTNAPLMIQLRQAIKKSMAFEVFPKMIISVTTEDKMAQQLHYILNKEKTGIFHLASQDVVHYDDLFNEIASKISNRMPIFKKVFSKNVDEYQAILPKENVLPLPYQITVTEVIEICTLNEEIITFKN